MRSYPEVMKYLPDGTLTEIDFKDSAFFQTPIISLPTPADVRALSSDYGKHSQPKPVIFRELKLLVKFGRYVTIEEALNLWMIKQAFGDEIPVPELYGWRFEDEYMYIYMQLLEGKTLQDSWEQLDKTDKASVRDDLCRMIGRLRQLHQDPSSQYVGSIHRKLPWDFVVEHKPKAGPFSSVKDFNDWFSQLYQDHLPP